jgi:hypothetical protein
MAECPALSLDSNFHIAYDIWFRFPSASCLGKRGQKSRIDFQQLSIPYNRLSAAGFQANDKIVNCEGDMLWTLFVVLLVLWLLGVVSSYTMGGFIHLLLVLAVIALVFQLITGRRAAV